MNGETSAIWSRRDMLKMAAGAMSVLLMPPSLRRAGNAWAAGTDPVLVRIYLAGGADALNLVAPIGDPHYGTLRPTLGIPATSALPLDGFFGLAPQLGSLQPWYQSGKLAFVHAVGGPTHTRSHFDEADFLEYGAPGDKTVRTGWLNRYLQAAGANNPLAGVTLSYRAARSLVGDAATLAIPSVVSLDLAGFYDDQRRGALEQMYAAAGGPLAQTVENAFDVYQTLRDLDRTTTVTYPSGEFGAALKDIAALIKADIGVRVAAADLGGWDHHVDEISKFPIFASSLASCLHAFATDLGPHLGRTAIVVFSEFGRRAAENASRGSDHGWAGVMMVLGGAVAGGRVVVRDQAWPGLAPAQLFEGMDLLATTDTRDVFAELLHRHMGLANLGGIFPGFTPSTGRYPGLFV